MVASEIGEWALKVVCKIHILGVKMVVGLGPLAGWAHLAIHMMVGSS